MAKEERCGNRKRREQFTKRVPDLGYYYVVTDTQATEENYLNGLRDSLPREIQGRLVIKVSTTSTDNLVSTCKDEVAKDSQYREPWIVFDRDKVPNFDEIIQEAKDSDINVGWSNPCIEIWFEAYFGSMSNNTNSVDCCHKLAEEFKKNVGHEYKKSAKDIYTQLTKHGNEKAAIKLAEKRYQDHLRNGKDRPSKMCPGTTLHRLVRDIKGKVKQ